MSVLRRFLGLRLCCSCFRLLPVRLGFSPDSSGYLMNVIPETFDVALQSDRYSADCQLCPWSTSIIPSHDNGWWFYSLRVHVRHFCPGRPGAPA